MIEQIQLVKRYGRLLWPYRWLALITAVVVALCGSVYVFSLPPTYKVSAKIFVDTRSMLRPLMKGLAVENDTLVTSAELMRRTLLTRPNIEKVARETDMDLTAEDEREFDYIVTRLLSSISIAGTPRDNIYTIAYSDQDPNLAKSVVDELLNTFLETALGTSRSDTAVTQKFIDEQIAEYEKRLIDAEDRLREFKQRNVGLMPTDNLNYYQRLEQANQQLQAARLALNEATRRRDELNRQLKDTIAAQKAGDAATSSLIETQYSERISNMESRLDDLLLQYTDKHPDIIGLQATLAGLREKHDKEIAKMTAELSGQSGGGVSDGYNDIRLALGEAGAEAAALQTRVQQYEKRVEDLKGLVNTLPEVEAELARLDRDYELNRAQHQELLERREAARLSHEVDQKADNVKLKVIEPPRTPSSPSGPDRLMFLSVAFLGALGAGGFLAFLMTQLNPRFFTSDELKEFAQLPIMGVVSMVSNKRQRAERRMELAVFGTMLLGLFAVYGGLMSLELMQFDIHQKVVKLLGQLS